MKRKYRYEVLKHDAEPCYVSTMKDVCDIFNSVLKPEYVAHAISHYGEVSCNFITVKVIQTNKSK